MSMRWFGNLFLGMIVCATTWAQDRAPSPPADDAPAVQEIEQWVRQLGADQYFVRDAATRRLISAGSIAVEVLTKALDDSDLEVTTRGIYVLQQLALSGDLTTEEAAQMALEKLAAARVTAAARRATDALLTLQDLKQDQALKELERLGAKVT